MKQYLHIFLFITAIASFLLISCQSLPNPNSFTLDNTIPVHSLANKTVFLKINMTDWGKAPSFLLDAAAIYNLGLKEIADEYNELQEQRIVLLDEMIKTFYKSLYNAEIASDSFPFPNKNFKVAYFKKPGKKTIKAIRMICNKHNAEYVLTFTGQMQTINVTGLLGRNANTFLLFEMVLFDKNGKIISRGTAQTEKTKIRSKDTDKFISLFDEINNPLKSLIGAMGG